MPGVPTSAELVNAVRVFLDAELAPLAADDDRVRFGARVATNILRQLERELAGAPRPGTSDAERELVRRIRAGTHDHDLPALLAELRPGSVDRVRIVNPRHLLERDRE